MNALINTILTTIDLRNNPYFTSLDQGTFNKDDFIETQMQFFFAVTFFSRPMASLAAKIPTADLRLEIVRNVWEEHGEGNLKIAHRNTFIEFLSRLANISEKDLDQKVLWPEIKIFNNCLEGTATHDPFVLGVSMMGIIERMFCEISTIIGEGLIKQKWFTTNNLIHYTQHAELDIKHAQDFFDIAEHAWRENDENSYQIEQGLLLGATLFNNLYKELYLNRKRRLTMRYKNLPHSTEELL